MHQDEAWQTPPEHRREQQSAPVAQGLFSVLQVVLSGVQVPMVQLPLQHSALLVQTLVSAVHAGRLQTAPVHVPEQQSEASVHAAPTWKQPVPPSPVPVPPKPTPVLPPVPVAPVPEPPVMALPVMVVPLEAPAPPAPPVLTLELPHPAASKPPAEKARATKRIMRGG
jgi:hypothetical protein